MAPRTQCIEEQQGRRSILKAGALAVGAALLPHSTAAAPTQPDALESLRARHEARVRELAALVTVERPAFATDPPDVDAEEEASYWLEDRCREHLCATGDDAWTVMLVSPHRPPGLLVVYGLEPAEDVADDAKIIAAWDVADALGAAWYARRNTPPDEVES